MTFQEIADMQGCPLSTVKTRLYQGLSLLRRHLEQHGQMVPRNGEAGMNRDIRVRRPGRARRVSVRRVRTGRAGADRRTSRSMRVVRERDRQSRRDSSQPAGLDASRTGAWISDSGAGSRTQQVPWWRAPLPAWAQAAAAVVIFGVGLSLGLARDTSRGASASSREQPAASRDQRRHTDRALSAGAAAQDGDVADAYGSRRRPCGRRQHPTTRSDEGGSTDRAEQERQQNRDFTLRSVDLASDFEAQRRIDMATVRETVGQFQGVAGTEIRQQREAIDRINNFIRVSQQGR